MTGGVGAAFLGLTMNCARCHDHKFDPISQKDYYRLEAFFSAAKPREVGPEQRIASPTTSGGWPCCRPSSARCAARWRPSTPPIARNCATAKLAKLEPPYRAALAVDASKRTPEQRKLAGQAETLLKVTWDEVVAALSPADRDRRAGPAPADARAAGEGRRRPRRAPGPCRGHRPAGLSRPAPRQPAPQGPARRAGLSRAGCRGGGKPTPNNRIGLAAWLTRPGPSPDGAGDRQSAVAASLRARAGAQRPTTSACAATGRAIPNCSTGWPWNWSSRAGRSSTSIA